VDRPTDPRLLQALALLHECLRDAGPSLAAPQAPEAWLESSTDVLTPWYPAAAASEPWGGLAPPGALRPAAWDAYFGDTPAGAAVTPALSEARARSATADRLEADTAEAALEALRGFVHALGRGDVEAALAHVSADYHTLEGDISVERDGLRQQLERLLDGRRGPDLHATLAGIPEPIPHALGVLVRVALQVDWRGADGLPQGLVLHRVAVLRREGERLFRLLALADVQP
jgi:hypothetical protein